MSGQQPSSPLIQAARLFAKTSQKSQSQYLTGRWGSLRVLILVNKKFIEGDAENGHSHVLMLSEAPPYQPKPQQASRPTQADLTPPWEDLPQSAAPQERPRYPEPHAKHRRPDDRLKKPAPVGGRTKLVDDLMPFAPEVR